MGAQAGIRQENLAKMTRSKRSPRVVIDTNVALSALVFAQGRLAPLRLSWQSSLCLPLISKATATEMIRVLAYPKFKLSAEEQQVLLADYLPYCSTINMPAKLPKVPACRDKFDEPFLQLAVVGKADFLISGDRDLLSLAGEFECPIMTADEFLKRMQK